MTQDPKAIRAAIKNFRRLLELEPRHRGYREQLAELYLADGRPGEAVRELIGLARDLHRDGFLDESVAATRRALRIDNNNGDALALLAGIYASAPRSALVPSVIAVVEDDPLDAMGRPASDPPLDAMALLAVHSADELGAELASQASADLSVSVNMSFDSVASESPDDRNKTFDLEDDGPLVNPTVDLLDADLVSDDASFGHNEALDAFAESDDDADPPSEENTSIREPRPSQRPAVSPQPSQRPAVPPHLDDPAGTIDVDIELFAASPSDSEDDVGALPPGPSATSAALLPQDAPPPSLRPTLPAVPLFSALPRAAIADLVDRAERRYFPAGALISMAGEPADGLYITLSGAVHLAVPVEGGPPSEVCTISAGGHFGESDLNARRTVLCTATALEPTEILKVAPERVAFLRRHYPAFERTLVESGELRIVTTLLTQSALFGSLPAKDRLALAGRFRPIALGAGEELLVEGAPPDGLYLVTRGALIVYQEGQTVTQIRAGDFVGVVSMLQQTPYSCTAIAGPACQVVCLDAEELEAVLSSYASVREAFWREARQRNGA